MPIMCFFYLI